MVGTGGVRGMGFDVEMFVRVAEIGRGDIGERHRQDGGDMGIPVLGFTFGDGLPGGGRVIFSTIGSQGQVLIVCDTDELEVLQYWIGAWDRPQDRGQSSLKDLNRRHSWTKLRWGSNQSAHSDVRVSTSVFDDPRRLSLPGVAAERKNLIIPAGRCQLIAMRQDGDAVCICFQQMLGF